MLADNSKWGQEVVRALKSGADSAGAEIKTVEIVTPDSQDFTAALSRIKDSGAKYVITALVYAKTDVLVKQWFSSQYPLMYGEKDFSLRSK